MTDSAVDQSGHMQVMRELHTGDIVEGVVMELTDTSILLDISYKTEAYISRDEIGADENIKINDTMRVEIVNLNTDGGIVLVSRNRATAQDEFQTVVAHYQEQREIVGKISAVKSHGFEMVLLSNSRTFMPFSHMDIDRPKIINPETYVGMEFPVLIIKAQKKRHTYDIVVSRKEYLIRESEKMRAGFFEKFGIGDVVTGVVESVFYNQAHVLVSGVITTLAQEEISWLNNTNLRSAVQIGESVRAKIIAISDDKKNISLSIKALEDDPWLTIEERLQIDSIVEGEVESAKNFGLFVRIDNRYQGLAHISEIDWNNRNPDLSAYAIGQKIKVKVLSIDAASRRLALSIKQIHLSPWEHYYTQHADKKVAATIAQIYEFGLLCTLDSEVEGFLHRSQIDWGNRPYNPAEFSVGDTMEVVPIAADNKRRKVQLSLKACRENPWDMFLKLKKEGAVIAVTIAKKSKDGLVVSVGEGVEGFIHFSHMANFEHLSPEDLLADFQAGDTLEANISFVDKAKRKIYLSTKHIEIAQTDSEMKKYFASENDEPTTNIADLTTNLN